MSQNLTRRALLRRGSAIAVAATAATTLPIAAAAALPDPDPVLEAWRAWRPLQEQAARLIVERKRIGEALPKEATRPVVMVTVPDDGQEIRMPSVDQYDRWIRFFDDLEGAFSGIDPAGKPPFLVGDWMRGYRRNFLRRFRRAEAKAQAIKDESGWTALNDRLGAIWSAQEPLWVAIRESAATSPAAIAAKIDCGLSWCDSTDFLADLPHCLNCSVVRNLMPQLPADMAAALEPIAAARGTILEAYLRDGA